MSATPPIRDEPPRVAVRKFTIAEYHRLADAGILTSSDRVELLEGWIVSKMVHNPPHDNAIELADEALREILPQGWRLRIQSSITTRDSEPEPDLAVVRGSPRGRGLRHPTPDEVALVVEVADSSLETDRDTKARLYARAGIPVYWIVNLIDRQVEVYGDPSGPNEVPGYGTKRVAHAGELLSVTIGNDAIGAIDVAHLLP